LKRNFPETKKDQSWYTNQTNRQNPIIPITIGFTAIHIFCIPSGETCSLCQLPIIFLCLTLKIKNTLNSPDLLLININIQVSNPAILNFRPDYEQKAKKNKQRPISNIDYINKGIAVTHYFPDPLPVE